ncbi:RNA polymerase sigma factor, sigma-70 family [Catalinimonas alkaloidigena]|uniref:RNA polymerase sigma factor, sigma-70 family n=1 Tax=Catalinimonas alkaloidigena TaxID=1075417 RepID=A0A1G9HJ10_9BACT|nr:sigma-70 family RNA polymerase sigma factor [Catalinimonas alkaloidigena]SDL12493.1 RNA polymerase sigma factor, sigma-70 family [Catalinimonas alkaloidigena]
MNIASSTTLNSRELWNRWRNGCDTSFAQLFDRHYEELYTYALRFADETEVAEDCLQEVFITLWHARARLQDVRSVGAYLRASIRYKICAVMQQNARREGRLELLPPSPPCDSPEELLIRQERHAYQEQCIQQLLCQLPKRQREVVYLRYFDDFSVQEIAQQLSINYQSVMNHLHRAMTRLREAHHTTV